MNDKTNRDCIKNNNNNFNLFEFRFDFHVFQAFDPTVTYISRSTVAIVLLNRFWNTATINRSFCLFK